MSRSFIKGGIIGVVVGAVSGLLFAPKSGKETRKDIKSTAKKVSAEAEKELKKLHSELQTLSVQGNDKLKDLKGKAKSDLDELVKRSDMAKDKIGEAISILREGDGEVVDVEKLEKEGRSVKDKLTKKLNSKK